MELADWIKKNDKNSRISFYVYAPYPGTPFYDLCIKNGYKEPKTLEEWGEFGLYRAKTPWVSPKYVCLIDQLNELYIPFLTNNIYVKLNKYGILGKIAKAAFLPLHGIVLLRWKLKFFSFPIEYRLIKSFKGLAKKALLRR